MSYRFLIWIHFLPEKDSYEPILEERIDAEGV